MIGNIYIEIYMCVLLSTCNGYWVSCTIIYIYIERYIYISICRYIYISLYIYIYIHIERDMYM